LVAPMRAAALGWGTAPGRVGGMAARDLGRATVDGAGGMRSLRQDSALVADPGGRR
jgi:hypothetical protein